MFILPAALAGGLSPDGKVALQVRQPLQNATLWDLTARPPVGQDLPLSARLSAFAFSPDGRLLVECEDGTARLWGPGRPPVPVGPPVRRPGVSLVAAFSSDGRWLATGAADGARL